MIATSLHYGMKDPMVDGPVIAETQKLWHDTPGLLSTILILGYLIGVFQNRAKIRAGELIWMAFAAALLWKMARFAPVFAIAAAPVFAITRVKMPDRALANPAIRVSLAAILVIGMARVAMVFPRTSVPIEQWLNRNGPDSPNYPCAAADFVAANVRNAATSAGRMSDGNQPAATTDAGLGSASGAGVKVIVDCRDTDARQRVGPGSGDAAGSASDIQIINEFSWGGYLEWRLGPRFKTLMDGRTQLFDAEFWHDTYLNGEDARRRKLATLSADAAVLPVKGSLFAPGLLSLGWRVAYQDAYAQVMLPPATPIGAKPATAKPAVADSR